MNHFSGLALLAVFMMAGCVSPPDTTPAKVWDAALKADTCMPGGQLWSEYEVGAARHEEMYSELLRVLRLPRGTSVPFLLERIGSTAPTSIHICPWASATEGELAVYLLGEMSGDRVWLPKEGEPGNENVQIALQTRLKDVEARKTIFRHYRRLFTDGSGQKTGEAPKSLPRR